MKLFKLDGGAKMTLEEIEERVCNIDRYDRDTLCNFFGAMMGAARRRYAVKRQILQWAIGYYGRDGNTTKQSRPN
jgi:hypothetical protein